MNNINRLMNPFSDVTLKQQRVHLLFIILQVSSKYLKFIDKFFIEEIALILGDRGLFRRGFLRYNLNICLNIATWYHCIKN